MTRPTILAAAAALILVAGCGARDEAAGGGAHNEAAMADNLSIEDVPSDSLAAPSDMPLDSESNGVGSASGGNAM
ncbi:hypothetical protein [Sphingomonas profundi]|uniref:hypothetical protein n=1 Tax=Alterirhizorhabdus profundi TaxID=2681549 RepID=UPI0012E8CE0F|nr:hypothetical protein [Sphingomonas profundi]